MATSKTLTPTNVTISIPEFTDQPDQRVNSNCIDKEADAINALQTNMSFTKVTVNQSAQAGRGTMAGSYMYNSKEVILNLIFTASYTATNSPGLMAFTNFLPNNDCSLSCIDITSGLTTAITSSIPCGIATNGTVYIKECATNHVYAISGTYIRA